MFKSFTWIKLYQAVYCYVIHPSTFTFIYAASLASQMTHVLMQLSFTSQSNDTCLYMLYVTSLASQIPYFHLASIVSQMTYVFMYTQKASCWTYILWSAGPTPGYVKRLDILDCGAPLQVARDNIVACHLPWGSKLWWRADLTLNFYCRFTTHMCGVS